MTFGTKLGYSLPFQLALYKREFIFEKIRTENKSVLGTEPVSIERAGAACRVPSYTHMFQTVSCPAQLCSHN